MSERIRIVIADDQELIRSGLRMVIDSDDALELVAEAANGAEAVDAVLAHHVDVVLMDVRMPLLDGIAATERIRALRPRTRVLVLTTYDVDDHAYAAIRSGASGFLVKDAAGEELLRAIHAVAVGDAVLAPSTTARLLPNLVGGGTRPVPELASLTERETEVLLQLATGATNAAIAQRLFLSPTTVKTHVGNIFAKLGVRDRVEAVVLAYESGLVRPGRGPTAP